LCNSKFSYDLLVFKSYKAVLPRLIALSCLKLWWCLLSKMA